MFDFWGIFKHAVSKKSKIGLSYRIAIRALYPVAKPDSRIESRFCRENSPKLKNGHFGPFWAFFRLSGVFYYPRRRFFFSKLFRAMRVNATICLKKFRKKNRRLRGVKTQTVFILGVKSPISPPFHPNIRGPKPPYLHQFSIFFDDQYRNGKLSSRQIY